MKKTLKWLRDLTEGHDLVEYAMMMAFVATVAGAVMPGVPDVVGRIIFKSGLKDPNQMFVRTVFGLLAVVSLIALSWRYEKKNEED